MEEDTLEDRPSKPWRIFGSGSSYDTDIQYYYADNTSSGLTTAYCMADLSK